MARTIAMAVSMLVLCTASAARAESPDDILIVVSNANPPAKTDIDEVRTIFLRTRTTWTNGERAVPIHAPAGSTLRKVFCERVLEMPEEGESRYWKEKQIRAGLLEPKSFTNTQKAVFKIRGGVSYVFRRDFLAGVNKVILEIPAAAAAVTPAVPQSSLPGR